MSLAGKNNVLPSPVPWLKKRLYISLMIVFQHWISKLTPPCVKHLKNIPVPVPCFIVTQRIATIKNSEQIIVLDEGKIVGKGTHQRVDEEL